MTNKTILTILLLAAFFSVQAQDVIPYVSEHRPLVFESVSFSNDCGNITITCSAVDKLTNFEITGKDAHLNFEWSDDTPADRFPMKLGIKSGDVIIKYKMRGQKSKTIRVKLAAHEELKLSI